MSGIIKKLIVLGLPGAIDPRDKYTREELQGRRTLKNNTGNHTSYGVAPSVFLSYLKKNAGHAVPTDSYEYREVMAGLRMLNRCKHFGGDFFNMESAEDNVRNLRTFPSALRDLGRKAAGDPNNIYELFGSAGTDGYDEGVPLYSEDSRMGDGNDFATDCYENADFLDELLSRPEVSIFLAAVERNINALPQRSR